jgi:hypothetical protein
MTHRGDILAQRITDKGHALVARTIIRDDAIAGRPVRRMDRG